MRPVLSTPKTFTLHVIDVTHDCRLFITCTVPPSCPSCPLLPSVRQYPPHPPACHAKSCLIPRSCEGSLPQTAARGFLWLLHPAPRVVAVHQRGRPALCLEVVVNGALAVQPVTVVVDDEESRGHEPVTYSSHSETHSASASTGNQHSGETMCGPWLREGSIANGTRSFGACFV